MSELRGRLESFDGKAVGFLSAAQVAFRGDAGFLSEVVELCCDGSQHVSAGASWMLKDELERGAHLSGEDVAKLLGGLDGVVAWQAQLHLCQCLEYVELSERDALVVARWAHRFETAARPFLRAWSLHLRVILARRFAALAGDGAAARLRGEADEAASVRARMRRLK